MSVPKGSFGYSTISTASIEIDTPDSISSASTPIPTPTTSATDPRLSDEITRLRLEVSRLTTKNATLLTENRRLCDFIQTTNATGANSHNHDDVALIGRACLSDLLRIPSATLTSRFDPELIKLRSFILTLKDSTATKLSTETPFRTKDFLDRFNVRYVSQAVTEIDCLAPWCVFLEEGNSSAERIRGARRNRWHWIVEKTETKMVVTAEALDTVIELCKWRGID